MQNIIFNDNLNIVNVLSEGWKFHFLMNKINHYKLQIFVIYIIRFISSEVFKVTQLL